MVFGRWHCRWIWQFLGSAWFCLGMYLIIVMKILPANSEGCWLFICVIFLSFGFCIFSIPVLWCHCFVILLSFVKSLVCHFLVIFSSFFCRFLVVFLLSSIVFHVFCQFPPSLQLGGRCPILGFPASMFEFFCSPLAACTVTFFPFSWLRHSFLPFLLWFCHRRKNDKEMTKQHKNDNTNDNANPKWQTQMQKNDKKTKNTK